MENHVHLCQSDRGIVFLLPIQGCIRRCFGFGAKKQRPGTACRIVDGSSDAIYLIEPQNLGYYPADLCRGIELAFAFSTFGRKIFHQVFIGIAYKVVIGCPVFAEIEVGGLEYRDKPAQCFDFILAFAELGFIVEIRNKHSIQLVGFGQSRHFLVHLLADVGMSFQSDEILKIATCRNVYHEIGVVATFVTDVFHEQNHQYIILILARIHASAKFIATFPKSTI